MAKNVFPIKSNMAAIPYDRHVPKSNSSLQFTYMDLTQESGQDWGKHSKVIGWIDKTTNKQTNKQTKETDGSENNIVRESANHNILSICWDFRVFSGWSQEGGDPWAPDNSSLSSSLIAPLGSLISCLGFCVLNFSMFLSALGVDTQLANSWTPLEADRCLSGAPWSRHLRRVIP